jgi:hypothetical protein
MIKIQKKKPRAAMPCSKCGGKVDPDEGPIGLSPWLCAKCVGDALSNARAPKEPIRAN